MNIITKTSALNLAIFSVLALNGAISALAGTASGGVVSTNILIQNDSAVITIGSSAASAENDQTGTVASSNIGNHLFRYPIVVKRVSSGISYYCIGGLRLYI
jgi:hypothetical protein